MLNSLRVLPIFVNYFCFKSPSPSCMFGRYLFRCPCGFQSRASLVILILVKFFLKCALSISTSLIWFEVLWVVDWSYSRDCVRYFLWPPNAEYVSKAPVYKGLDLAVWGCCLSPCFWSIQKCRLASCVQHSYFSAGSECTASPDRLNDTWRLAELFSFCRQYPRPCHLLYYM